MKIIKKISLLVASLAVFGALLVPSVAFAADGNADAVCDGLALTGSSCSDTSGPSVDSTIKLVINVLSLIVGVVAVIMIIIGGLKYITSSGDSGNVTSAKNTILYAIIGLVIVVLAQVIVRFVLNQAAPETTTQTNVPSLIG